MIKILLDFDGVIFKNKKIHSIVHEKAVDYISDRLNISKSEAYKINDIHYKKYGHTTINLSTHTDIIDYNNYVFNDELLRDIKKYLTDDDIELIHSINELSNQYIWKHYLFSNAPLEYCSMICDSMDCNLYNIFEDDTFTTVSNLYEIDNDEDLRKIKPLPLSYKNINDVLTMSSKIYFFDDNKTNLVLNEYNSNWTNIHVDKSFDLHFMKDIYDDIWLKSNYQAAQTSPENPSILSKLSN